MKRLLLIVILVLTGLILGGCTLISPPGTKKVTIKYWGLWEPENVLGPIIAEYQKQNPSITIQYSKQSPRDYREKLQNALVQGTGPDVFRLHNSWLPMFGNDLSALPKNVMDAKTFESTFYPVAKSDLKIGNEYYAIPLEIDTLALFYNTDLFRSAGVDSPRVGWDWTDFQNTATRLTNKTKDGRILIAGAAMGRTSNVDHWPEIIALMMLQTGVDLKNPSNPEKMANAEQALSYFTNFTKDTGKTWDDTLPNSTEAFIQGKLAMYFAPSWRTFDIKAGNPDLKFKTIPVPELEGGNITYASYWVEGVSKKSKVQKEAWDFLKFLSLKETEMKLYNEERKIRDFGEPYSRVDLGTTLKDDPLVGPFINMAPSAKSWYLASFTNDGDTGINSKINKYFENAINSVVKNEKEPKDALVTLSKGINQILSAYKLVPAGR